MIKRIDTGIAKGAGEFFRCHSEGAVTNYRISDEPGSLVDFLITNATETAGFVQLFDAKELPEEGTVPLLAFPLAAGKGVGMEGRVSVTEGLVVAISTDLEELAASTNGAMIFANFIRR